MPCFLEGMNLVLLAVIATLNSCINFRLIPSLIGNHEFVKKVEDNGCFY
jgi:hypothetical protein